MLGVCLAMSLYRPGDQIYMAVCFWYLVKSDLSDVRMYSRVHCSSHFYKVPEKHSQVYLVGYDGLECTHRNGWKIGLFHSQLR